MQDKGLITGDLWLHSAEIGREIAQVEGSLTIDTLDINVVDVDGLGEVRQRAAGNDTILA